MAKPAQPSQPVVSAPVTPVAQKAVPSPAERLAEQMRVDPARRAEHAQAVKAHEDAKGKAALKAAREKIEKANKDKFEATRSAVSAKADASKGKKGPPKSARQTMIPQMVAHRAHQQAQAAAAEAEAQANESELLTLEEQTKRDAEENGIKLEGNLDKLDGLSLESEGLDEALAARAKAAGFSDAELEGMDAELLGKALEVIERSKPAEPEAAAEKPKPKKPADSEFTIKLDPEIHDPEVVTAFQSLTEQVVALREQLDAVHADTTRQRQDRLIDGLGDEFADVIKVASNRAKLLDDVKVRAAGYEALGKKAPTDETLIRQAAMALFADQRAKAQKRKADDKLRDRQGQFIGGAPHIPSTLNGGRSTGLGVVAQWRARLAAKDFAAS